MRFKLRDSCVIHVLVLASIVGAAAENTSFSFASFDGAGGITQVGDARYNAALSCYDVNHDAFATGSQEQRCGRILYRERVRTASFATAFTFSFLQTNPMMTECGSGMVFGFVGGVEFTAVQKSRRGRGMCTFNPDDRGDRVFAVKFDSSQSPEFGDLSDGTVGVVVSNRGTTRVEDHNLCGQGVEDVAKPASPVLRVTNLSLHEILDEEMFVGFTVSTFQEELHRIRSWRFSSSSELPARSQEARWVAGAVSGAVLGGVLLLAAGVLLRCRMRGGVLRGIDAGDAPRTFSYKELSKMTKRFSEKERLFSGALWDVYRGMLPSGAMVAVKSEVARLIDHSKLQRTTLLAGTLGYMAPEMQHTGRATKETDVYAFGILVLEVVCERRPLAMQAVEPGEFVLLDRVWRAHAAGNITKLMAEHVVDDASGAAVLAGRAALLSPGSQLAAQHARRAPLAPGRRGGTAAAAECETTLSVLLQPGIRYSAASLLD